MTTKLPHRNRFDLKTAFLKAFTIISGKVLLEYSQSMKSLLIIVKIQNICKSGVSGYLGNQIITGSQLIQKWTLFRLTVET